jgi:hypothetical protein
MDDILSNQNILTATLLGGVVGGFGLLFRKLRRFITIMSMGLTARPGRTPKAHSIIDLRALKPSTSERRSMEEQEEVLTMVQQYLAVIGNRRSIKSTMTKQVPKAVQRHGIELCTNKKGSPGLNHFQVLYSHEASVRADLGGRRQ